MIITIKSDRNISYDCLVLRILVFNHEIIPACLLVS